LLEYGFSTPGLELLFEVSQENEHGFVNVIMDSIALEKLIKTCTDRKPEVSLYLLANKESQSLVSFIQGERETVRLDGIRPGLKFANSKGEERVSTQRKANRTQSQGSGLKKSKTQADAFKADPSKRTVQNLTSMFSNVAKKNEDKKMEVDSEPVPAARTQKPAVKINSMKRKRPESEPREKKKMS